MNFGLKIVRKFLKNNDYKNFDLEKKNKGSIGREYLTETIQPIFKNNLYEIGYF